MATVDDVLVSPEMAHRGGWPAGRSRTPEERDRISAGLLASDSFAARRVWKECAWCRTMFTGGNSNQKTCSIACAGMLRNPEGRKVTSSGYVMVRTTAGWAKEHRVVMEGILGRPLTPTESVHHRNGDRADNRPENLELRTRYHGKGATVHCPTCQCEVSPQTTDRSGLTAYHGTPA